MGRLLGVSIKSKRLREFKKKYMSSSEIFHKYCFTLQFNLLIYTFKMIGFVVLVFVSEPVGTDWHVQ